MPCSRLARACAAVLACPTLANGCAQSSAGMASAMASNACTVETTRLAKSAERRRNSTWRQTMYPAVQAPMPGPSCTSTSCACCSDIFDRRERGVMLTQERVRSGHSGPPAESNEPCSTGVPSWSLPACRVRFLSLAHVTATWVSRVPGRWAALRGCACIATVAPRKRRADHLRLPRRC